MPLLHQLIPNQGAHDAIEGAEASTGQRGILELRFPSPGSFMFHAHKTEFAELAWLGFFEVV